MDRTRSFYTANFGYRSPSSPGSTNRVLPTELPHILIQTPLQFPGWSSAPAWPEGQGFGDSNKQQDRSHLVRALQGNLGSLGSSSLLAGTGTWWVSCTTQNRQVCMASMLNSFLYTTYVTTDYAVKGLHLTLLPTYAHSLVKLVWKERSACK